MKIHIVITGPVASGKTHLARKIASLLLEEMQAGDIAICESRQHANAPSVGEFTLEKVRQP